MEWHVKPRCPKQLGQITRTAGVREKRMSGGDPLRTIPSCSRMREASPMRMSNRRFPCSIGGRAPIARSGTAPIHPTDSGMAKPTMGRPHCCCYWAGSPMYTKIGVCRKETWRCHVSCHTRDSWLLPRVAFLCAGLDQRIASATKVALSRGGTTPEPAS